LHNTRFLRHRESTGERDERVFRFAVRRFHQRYEHVAAGRPGILARQHATVVEDQEPAENVQTVGALTQDPDDHKRRFTFVRVVSMGARLFQVRDNSIVFRRVERIDAERVDRVRRLVKLS